jgi:polyphosphate kinase 2 (PPK2 family)
MKAKAAMLFTTDTADAPWTIVRSDAKRRARLNAMLFVLHAISYAGRDAEIVARPDEKLVGSARDI